ncbi:MAG: hypothetical protein ACEQSK_17080 [Sphingomonadaceae bacterium]
MLSSLLSFSCRGATLNQPTPTEQSLPPDASLRLALAEVRDLQRTVVVLRDELEAAQRERQRQVQDALAAHHNETQQIKDTVLALRLALERSAQEKADALQQAATAHRTELAQLHETIYALRNALEGR